MGVAGCQAMAVSFLLIWGVARLGLRGKLKYRETDCWVWCTRSDSLKKHRQTPKLVLRCVSHEGLSDLNNSSPAPWGLLRSGPVLQRPRLLAVSVPNYIKVIEPGLHKSSNMLLKSCSPAIWPWQMIKSSVSLSFFTCKMDNNTYLTELLQRLNRITYVAKK